MGGNLQRALLKITTTCAAIHIATTGCVSESLVGEEEANVVVGTQENDANFPWVVSILDPLAGPCFGTLISEGSATGPAWALTAAHCVTHPGITVSYSRTDPSTGVVTGASRSAIQVYKHDFWDGLFVNDIAVVSFPRFDPDPLLIPASLPFWTPFPDQTFEVANTNDHTAILPPGKVAVYRGYIHAPDTFADGGSAFYSRSAWSTICPGDSGSGLIMRGGGKNYVYGVVSASLDPGPCSSPGYLFRSQNVYWHKSWILAKTGIPTTDLATWADKSDILWRRNDGALAIWKMSGDSHSDVYPSYYGNGLPVPLEWKIAGTGDVTGDWYADIVFRHASNNSVAVWKLVNGVMVADTYPTEGGAVPNSNWAVLGVGDVNADGRDDIIWRNRFTGAVKAWQMDANGQRSSTTATVNLSTSYSAVGIGKVQNGSWDNVLLRNMYGDVYVLSVASGSIWYLGTRGVEWEVEAVGDLTGDGRADIVWRNHSTMAMAVWRLVSPSAYADEPVNWAYVGLDWQVQGVGDFNGDGAADILWRNTGDPYAVVVWSMLGGLNYQQSTLSYGLGEWNIEFVDKFAN